MEYSKVIEKSDGDQNLSFSFDPIAFVESPFEDRFGVPRQPAVGQSLRGKVRFRSDPDLVSALRELDQFSHIWLIFVFHRHGGRKWKPSIRPPRLGGRKKVGVLASRSPHRPNPVGLSLVRIEDINLSNSKGPVITVSGLDLLNGTPVLDIKPYIPYADFAEGASSGWATESIPQFEVKYSEEIEHQFFLLQGIVPDFKVSLLQILSNDPRPSHRKRDFPIGSPQAEGQCYGLAFMGFEIKYKILGGVIIIQSIDPSID